MLIMINIARPCTPPPTLAAVPLHTHPSPILRTRWGCATTALLPQLRRQVGPKAATRTFVANNIITFEHERCADLSINCRGRFS